MASKLTIDMPNRLIVAKPGVTDLDAAIDLYSDLKEDWLANANGETRMEFPVRTIGGDPLGAGLQAGAYFFLRNDLGWRIRPQEADHELVIVGNLYPESPAYDMFVPTLGAYTVAIKLERASLTQLAGELLNPLPIAELPQGQPPARPTLKQAVMFLYMSLRNKLERTQAAVCIHDDAGTVIAKAPISGDTTKFTRGKMEAGP